MGNTCHYCKQVYLLNSSFQDEVSSFVRKRESGSICCKKCYVVVFRLEKQLKADLYDLKLKETEALDLYGPDSLEYLMCCKRTHNYWFGKVYLEAKELVNYMS